MNGSPHTKLVALLMVGDFGDRSSSRNETFTIDTVIDYVDDLSAAIINLIAYRLLASASQEWKRVNLITPYSPKKDIDMNQGC